MGSSVDKAEAWDAISAKNAEIARLRAALDECRMTAESERHTLPSNCGCRHSPMRSSSKKGCCCRDTQRNLATEIARIIARAKGGSHG